MYIGRFAPSPTGLLHFGSLLAAVASYLDAKKHQGKWLVRIEDIDRPREVPGSAEKILKTLEALGMFWDGEVIYQSARSAAYERALEALGRQGLIYRCTCSRKEIADTSAIGIEGPIYPGTCREGASHPGKSTFSWRIRTTSDPIGFEDRIQGTQTQRVAQQVGDYILKRADGLYAYQLAVVVDDFEQDVTHVVRGADLLTSTPRQIHLQKMLGFPMPVYAHIPIAINANGEKLSKQTLAKPVETTNPKTPLWQALQFLGQQPPADLRQEPLHHLWRWAIAHWDITHIPHRTSIPEPLI